MVRPSLIATISVVALLYAGAARANGAFPDSQSIMTPESRPHEIRLATNFGIIASDDDGQNWVWSCERPETNNGSLYQMGPAPTSRLYVISSEGMAFSDDDTCGWTVARVPSTSTTIFDAFPDPTKASRVLAVAATANDAGVSYSAMESSDSGATFATTRYTAAMGDNLTGIEIAKANPQTVYMSILSGPTLVPKLARTTDGGTTWKAEDLSAKLPTKTTLIRIIAVDPTNADRVYLRTHSAAGDAFAVAVAGTNGFTVTTPLTFPDGILSAYARLSTGTIVLAAVVGLDNVAYRSTDGGATFQPLPAPPNVRALSARGTTLYVVADNEADGYAVGTSVDMGQTWQPLMRYDQIAAIQACVHATCQVDCLMRASSGQWADDFCAATAPAPHDAGGEPPDAGDGMDATAPADAAPKDSGGGGSGGTDASVGPPSKSGCGCAVGDGGTPGAALVIVALAFAALVRRRAPSP
ncbi:MAG TPA: MYXO-CTERM sorting domain-containing protein [Polyangia bacterium]|nr:MYXO-CTERM sorting domain-containing protein [Polyangia bacterium]